MPRYDINPKCTNCGGTERIHDEKTGDIICGKCSFIIGKIIDLGQEWSEFDEKGKKQRRTGPTKGTLMTEVGKDYKDVYKNAPSGEARPTLARIRKEQERAARQDPAVRNFERAEEEANGIISRLELPDSVMISFEQLYKKLLRKKYTRGRPTNETVAALIFLICKKHELPWKASSIANDSNISSKQLWSSFKEIQQLLNIKVLHTGYKYYIASFVSELKLPPRIMPLAIQIIAKTKTNLKKKGFFNLMAKDPKGVAAAGIYSACLLLCEHDETCCKTQKEIMKVADVSEPTLRKRWSIIKDNTDFFKGENVDE